VSPESVIPGNSASLENGMDSMALPDVGKKHSSAKNASAPPRPSDPNGGTESGYTSAARKPPPPAAGGGGRWWWWLSCGAGALPPLGKEVMACRGPSVAASPISVSPKRSVGAALVTSQQRAAAGKAWRQATRLCSTLTSRPEERDLNPKPSLI
jgi:hypothetical protein